MTSSLIIAETRKFFYRRFDMTMNEEAQRWLEWAHDRDRRVAASIKNDIADILEDAAHRLRTAGEKPENFSEHGKCEGSPEDMK